MAGHKPLKIGILNDLVAQRICSKTTGRRLLHIYTNRRMYLQALKASADRIDLEGNASGTVTAEEAVFAQERLSSMDAAKEAVAALGRHNIKITQETARL
jgi:ProP effector